MGSVEMIQFGLFDCRRGVWVRPDPNEKIGFGKPGIDGQFHRFKDRNRLGHIITYCGIQDALTIKRNRDEILPARLCRICWKGIMDV